MRGDRRTVKGAALVLALWCAVTVGAEAGGSGRTPSLDALKAGYSSMEAGAYREALEHYRRALDHATSTELRFQANLGIASAASADGDLETARDAYARALDIRPDHAETLFSYGLLLKQLDADREAATYFARAAVEDPGLVQALVELGIVYARLGRHMESGRACRRAIEKQPGNLEAQLCAGVADFHLGRFAEAQRGFETVLEADPGNPRAHFGLGLARLFQQDRDGAIEQYVALKDLDADLARDLYEQIFPGQ